MTTKIRQKWKQNGGKMIFSKTFQTIAGMNDELDKEINDFFKSNNNKINIISVTSAATEAYYFVTVVYRERRER